MFVDRPRPIGSQALARDGNAASRELRGQRGLGRDLAAILEGTFDRQAPAVGLTQLLGERRPSTPSVRKFVVDIALAAMADAFEADAIVLARRRCNDEAPIVSTRLPPSWDDESAMKFALVDQVWRLLEDGPAPERGLCSIDGLHTWIGGHRGAEATLAAAVARRDPLTERERIALGRVVRSVASAVDDEPTPLPNGSRLSVSLTTTDLDSAGGDTTAGIRAVVALRGGGERRTAAAEAVDADVAVATAALDLAGVADRTTVTFAGRAAIEGMSVSIVVLEQPNDAPLLGFVVSDGPGGTGAAEAVFAALAA